MAQMTLRNSQAFYDLLFKFPVGLVGSPGIPMVASPDETYTLLQQTRDQLKSRNESLKTMFAAMNGRVGHVVNFCSHRCNNEDFSPLAYNAELRQQIASWQMLHIALQSKLMLEMAGSFKDSSKTEVLQELDSQLLGSKLEFEDRLTMLRAHVVKLFETTPGPAESVETAKQSKAFVDSFMGYQTLYESVLKSVQSLDQLEQRFTAETIGMSYYCINSSPPHWEAEVFPEL